MADRTQPLVLHHKNPVPSYVPNTWRCSMLHNACLTLSTPQPTCSARCRKRPWRLDVYGPNASSQVRQVLAERRFMRDPIESFKLRPLQRDVHNMSAGAVPPSPILRGEAGGLTMIWPVFEPSYGDFWRDTMLPLGHLLSLGRLPHRLGFSGLPTGSGALARTNAVEGLERIRSVCTFERTSPRTLRCEDACYESVRLCEILPHSSLRGSAAWLAMASLDAALGFKVPQLKTSAVSAEPGVLRVLLAARFP